MSSCVVLWFVPSDTWSKSRRAVASRPSSSASNAACMRTYGVAAFLNYYEQSPEQRDPALFAANFQSFWNVTLDDAWTAFHVMDYASGETKICPCSLPPLAPTGLSTDLRQGKDCAITVSLPAGGEAAPAPVR